MPALMLEPAFASSHVTDCDRLEERVDALCVAIAGAMMLMPGLGKVPHAKLILGGKIKLTGKPGEKDQSLADARKENPGNLLAQLTQLAMTTEHPLADLIELANYGRLTNNRPGPHQRLMLPGPGLVFEIVFIGM